MMKFMKKNRLFVRKNKKKYSKKMNNKFKKINSFLMKNFAKNYCKLLIKLWEKNAKNQNYNNHVNKTVYVEKNFQVK